MSSTTLSTASTTTDSIPLTTIFTQPDWCTDLAYTFGGTLDGTSVFIHDAYLSASNSACHPYHFANVANAVGIYSPGVCPSGWLAALTEQDEAGAAFTSVCCPSGRSYDVVDDLRACWGSVTTPTVVVFSDHTNMTMSTPFVVADYLVEVAWASSDLDSFTPRSAPLLNGARRTSSLSNTLPAKTKMTSSPILPTRSANTPSTTHAGSSANHSASGPGLSSGAKAGIGVGVAIAVLAAVVLIAFLIRRRRKTPARGGEEKAQLDNTPRDETSGKSRPTEVDPSASRAEPY